MGFSMASIHKVWDTFHRAQSDGGEWLDSDITEDGSNTEQTNSAESQDMVALAIEKFKESIERMFEKMNENNEDTYRGNLIRIRVAQLVHPNQVVFSNSKLFSNMRSGVIFDKAIKQLANSYTAPQLTKGELKEKCLDTSLGIRVCVFGSVDLMLNLDGMVIPVEVKNSNHELTISRGRIQAGIYAWLYDSPFALLVYGADLRVDIISPYTDDEIETMIYEVLKCWGTLAKKELCIKLTKQISECKQKYRCEGAQLPQPKIIGMEVRW